MKSVGESMGIGRTFTEAFAKARRSLELDTPWEWRPRGLHPWFAHELERVDEELAQLGSLGHLTTHEWLRLKRVGISDEDVAAACGVGELEARKARLELGVRPAYRVVDSVAGEVDARSNYYYSTWGETEESPPTGGRPRVVILGSGPNRIGQGIEFDYCCVHAAQSFKSLGYEAVMVNCNPETVSTDYDTSDRLYFEPLDAEAVLAVCEREQPEGVVIQFGGQTPLKLARPLEQAGFRILGTPFDAVDLAEDRARFAALAESAGVAVPQWSSAASADEAVAFAERIGYPVLARPSYVLGGRAMRVCYGRDELRQAVEEARGAVLVDRFLQEAVEIDVDAVCDGRDTYVAGVMEHVEHAGIHSGDSSCVLPAPSVEPEVELEIMAGVRRLGRALGVRGLFNVQFALSGDELYVLEANPRASRTVPFLSKARGINLVDVACRVAAGAELESLELPPERAQIGVSVKAAVLPFVRLPGSDPLLGPEMHATGEVMATADDLSSALARAERAAGRSLPDGGTAFFAVGEADAEKAGQVASLLAQHGFRIAGLAGTAAALRELGLQAAALPASPDVGTVFEREELPRCAFVVSTLTGSDEGAEIRRAAVAAGVPCFTTIAGARAAANAVAVGGGNGAVSLQERIHDIWAELEVAAVPEVGAG
jgi:carbamoyl-phosphate synthase large subunit